MLEKSATHRKGCIAGILHALGGPDPLTPISSASTYEGLLVDKEIVRKRYLEDVETCIRIGARDKDIEVRQIAKRCWEIYRSEFSERVARYVATPRQEAIQMAYTNIFAALNSFAGPLTPIARRYLELPPMGQPIPDYAQSSTASLISRPSKTTTHPPEGANAGPSHPTARPHALPAAPRGPPPTKPIANQNPTIHTVHRAPGRMMPANPTEGPASVLSQAAKGTLPSSSSSLSTSQGPSRPPPTLFARRVLPPSSAISMGSRANEARLLSSTGSLTTFPRDHPLASTSHGSPATVLPKNISLDAPNHSNQAWSTHQPPLILPADNHTSAPAQASQSESSQRPALACSLSSGVASTSTSPSKEPFRPTSSAPSRFHDRDDDPIRHAPISSTLNQPGAPIHAAKVEPPQQRRVVPAQVHRAPTRATRRASRVLPPSTDFQDFLSSTAAAAASESQWPVPSAPTASATGLAEIPTKRSASAMSTASLSSSTVAVFPMERSVSPTGTHPTQIQPVKDALPEATDTSQSLVNTSSTDSTTRENCVPQEEDVIILSQSDVADSARSAIATGFTLQTTTQMLPADSASSSHGTDICLTPQIIPPMRTSQPSGASQASLSPQIVSTSLVVADKLGDGLQGGIHRESGSESERKAAHAEVQASEVPDTATTTDEEVNLANKPYSDIMGSSAASKDLPHSVDIAALAANLPLAKREITGETSRPPLAGARQKTAFRPQKPHKSTEELAWMPLPALIADKVYSNAEPSGSVLSSSSAKHDSTVTAASAHNEDKPSVSEQQNLKSSLNLGRPPARAEQAPRQAQIRSVSTTSTSAQPPAGGAVLLRSSHPVRAVRPRQPIIPAPRQVQVSEKVKPPPTKKQILSFSTGSRVERPVYGGGAARSVNPSTRPAVSANSSRLPASNASSTARQGSIFSRLTAPTAASAGKAKPRIPSESKETFKKPLLSSRPPVKKASTVSLKSSQGSQDRLARVLKDETNTANIARTQSSAPTSANVDKALNQQEKLAQIENTQALATSTASLDPSATDPGITAEAASVHSAADSNLQSRNNNADTDSDTTATSSLAESYRKSQESTALPVLPTPSLKVKHDEYSVLQAATSIPLPSSPSTFAVVVQPHKSNSILAELGIIDAGASQTTNVPSPTRSLVDNKSFSRESHSNSSGAAVSDSVARIDQANAHKDKEAPELEQIQAVSPNSEATVQEIGSKRSVQTEMLDDNAESFASADATVILHNLEELGLDSTANTDPAIGQIEAPEATDRILDYLTSASQQSDSSKDIAPVSASSTPIKAPAQSTTNASLPKLSPEQPPTERSQSPKPEDVPLPHDVTAAFDASLSILASPIRGMRELLARSTGPQALEERSPLLLEKEYLPENAAGQYEYDDTVLDMYCTTSEMRGGE